MELLDGMGEAEAGVALPWPCGCVSVGHITHKGGKSRALFAFKPLSPLALVRRLCPLGCVPGKPVAHRFQCKSDLLSEAEEPDAAGDLVTHTSCREQIIAAVASTGEFMTHDGELGTQVAENHLSHDSVHRRLGSGALTVCSVCSAK